jgi:hypothetical protein
MVEENVKSYGDSKEMAHVISSTGDAVTAVADVMEAVDMDSRDVCLCVLKYIDKAFKPGRKGHALLLVIDELSSCIPEGVKFHMTVDGKEMSIKDYLRTVKDKDSSVVDTLKDILGDD